MNAIYIILIIIGYILLSAVTALILNKTTEPDKHFCTLCGIVWPFVLIWAILLGLVWIVLTGIEWLGDKWEEAERNIKTKSTDN